MVVLVSTILTTSIPVHTDLSERRKYIDFILLVTLFHLFIFIAFRSQVNCVWYRSPEIWSIYSLWKQSCVSMKCKRPFGPVCAKFVKMMLLVRRRMVLPFSCEEVRTVLRIQTTCRDRLLIGVEISKQRSTCLLFVAEVCAHAWAAMFSCDCLQLRVGHLYAQTRFRKQRASAMVSSPIISREHACLIHTAYSFMYWYTF